MRLLLTGQVRAHPDGKGKPSQEEGTLYAKAQRYDRRPHVERMVSTRGCCRRQHFLKTEGVLISRDLPALAGSEKSGFRKNIDWV